MEAGVLLLTGTSGVAIGGQALLLEGAPGCGKSSLALALVDRGAVLIGDDGVVLTKVGGSVVAAPPPRIAGLLEIRNVGLVTLPTTTAPAALILHLEPEAPRFPETPVTRKLLGVPVPVLHFRGGDAVQAVRAEHALRVHGLAL